MSDTHSPLVSVLVPICNVEKYLEQCLESARAQTLEDIEVICINDGSTDGSLGIINSFVEKDHRFKVIDKPNSGYGDSMNKGLEMARGKYIAILESDDFLEPEALEYMYGEAERQELDVLKCNFWLYWSATSAARLNRHDVYFPAVSTEMVLMGVHRPVDVPDIFWAKASIWSALYRRDFLDEHGIRFLPTPGASFQDTSFSFKVYACAERAAYSSRAFLHYRQDNEKSSVNNPGKVFCVCDEHAEMSRFLNEERPDLKPALDPVRAKVKFFNYRWNLYRLAPNLRVQFLERFSAEMREEIEGGNILRANGPFERYGFSQGEVDEANEIAYESDLYGVRSTLEGGGKLDTFKAYLHAGGFPLICKVIGKKLSRR